MDDNAMQDGYGANEKLDTYEVGYGKPPKATRFRKGISGNPKGRPKNALDFGSAVLREARTLVTINENGRKKRVSKNGVLAKQLYKLAMTGNIPAARLLLPYHQNEQDKAAQIEVQRIKDLERKSARDYTEEELRQFLRDYQKTEEWMERKKLLSSIE